MTIPPGTPVSGASESLSRRRLLLVDDEPAVLALLRRQLEQCAFEVTAFATADEALFAATSQQFDCAVLDYSLRGTTGIELMQELRAIDSSLAIVLLTGTIDIPQTVRAIQSGAEDVQTKPHSMPLLQAALERGLERTQLERSRRMMASQFTDPYGILDPSPPMRRVLRRVQQAARLDLPLLLMGEAGTGRRAVAEMAHQLSPKADERFVAIAMRDRTGSAIEDSIASFFDSNGRSAPSNFGTLFLDDFGNIDERIQHELIRALQSATPFRLIVSARHDLADDVKSGRLLPDLHRRFASLPIAIPALRERGAEAVVNLATRMLQRLRIENGEGPDSFSASAIDWISNLHWPSNIPQMRDVVTEAFSRAIGETVLDTEHLEPSLVTRGIHAGTSDADVEQWSLSAMERRQIVSVLGMSGNNRSQAARLLGITRTTLYKKLREYGLDPNE